MSSFPNNGSCGHSPREPKAFRVGVWAMVAGASLMSLGGGLSARAAEPASTKRVFVGDLNLHSDAGRSTMHRRVRLAARQVCGAPIAGDVHQIRSAHACVRTAVKRALSRADRAIALARNDR